MSASCSGERRSGSVSVVVPVYNRAGLVGCAIESLLAQPAVDMEIIVVDDGSTDDTPAVIERLSKRDGRIRLLRTSHRGVAAARNTGVEAAAGEFITFLDSDDLAAPARIARQVGKLMQLPAIAAVVGHRMWFSNMDRELRPLPGSVWEKKLDICLASATFRHTLFDRFGLFDEALVYGEDIDFYFRLFEADETLLIEPDIATYYRRHDTNMTADRGAMAKSCLRAFHNSIDRRRKAGRTSRLDVFFFRSFEQETLFVGGRYEPFVNAGSV